MATPHVNFRLDETTRQLMRETADWYGLSLTGVVQMGVRLAHNRMAQERAAQARADQTLATNRKKSRDGA
jgi:antitoxin component of RelBE/YafQ-DinJ toxin-antitoxin module